MMKKKPNKPEKAQDSTTTEIPAPESKKQKRKKDEEITLPCPL
ncbi:hypothetical protein [Alcaligenes endophyticus]|nr:hypothetical protein [Alcaligenes endophyticus]MCX5591659.1 hypothetical protein [Alcaligenes endophyticus]